MAKGVVWGGGSGARQIAEERTEPYTALEHATACGWLDEYHRDIPESCTCVWIWRQKNLRYERIFHATGCPWHA